MIETREFQQRTRRIEELIGNLERTADPQVRATAKELMQSVLELHGAGIEKMLETISAGEEGPALRERLGRDPLVGSLLILYGLHPEDFPARVRHAVEKLRAGVGSLGARIELAAIEDSVVRLRVHRNGNGAAAGAIRAEIEEALYAAAPDLTSLIIDGLEQQAASGFVPLEKLGGLQPAAAGKDAAGR